MAKQQVDIESFRRNLAQQIREKARTPDIHSYVPHAKQEIFHKGTQKKKLYLGGNRSGKTEGGVVEDIWWAMGKHPYREVPPAPNYGRVVGVDFTNGIAKILLPKFSARLPPSLLRNGSWEDSFNKEFRTLTLSNKSTIEFMSYDQDTDKFAGTARHWTHFDEEAPKTIFDECTARLIDYGGSWWKTMTPVEGMTWVYDTLYKGHELDDGLLVIEADMFDNPHINAAAGAEFLAGLGKEERKARQKGTFVSLGGKVYKSFDRTKHVIPQSMFTIPVGWEIYASVDHGFNNPTAWYWHAVGPENQVVTFSEHYAAEMTVAQHAAIVTGRELGFDRPVYMRVGDPAMKQRSAVSGLDIFTEYTNYGVNIVPAPTRDTAVGINRINGYLKTARPDGLPYWLITDNCVNLISELEHVHWDKFVQKKAQYDNNKKETIHKKDDHGTDSCRYFFTLRPDLTPVAFEPKAMKVARDESGSYDDMLIKSLSRSTTQWQTTDVEELYE